MAKGLEEILPSTKTKITRSAFNSAIRAKMLESQDISNLEIIDDSQTECDKLNKCGYTYSAACPRDCCAHCEHYSNCKVKCPEAKQYVNIIK